MSQNKKVLISGASIAGPALALWLDRYGFNVTVVEKAPEFRRGGLPVDFKGVTHRTVLDRMGILEDVQRSQTERNGDGAIINSRGEQIASMPAEFSAGEIEIARGDLARILFERTASRSEYMFADSIASLTETAVGVEVTFERSEPRVFDLVVGADGLHSNVRRLAFGPEADYVNFLGYNYAIASLQRHTFKGNVMYNEPGRMVMTGGTETPALFVFASEPLSHELDSIEQKRLLMNAYVEGGWELPKIMKGIPDAVGFYMDSISRVTIDRYCRGRVVLVGDSAYGNTLGGFGTGLAIVGAYVLAGELHRSNSDYEVAYANYESKLKRYAKVSQKVNGGSIMAPLTPFGLYARNLMFSAAPLAKGLMTLIDHFATDIELEDYSTGVSRPF